MTEVPNTKLKKKDADNMLKNQDKAWQESVKQKIVDKMSWVSEKSKKKIPYTTIDGEHDNRIVDNPNGSPDDGINWWTNGFWGGMMWQLYHLTKDEKYKGVAEFSEQQLDSCFEKFHGLHHDVGFMWLPTSVANYRLTGNKTSRKRALHAANLLAGRYNPVGEFIRAWDNHDNHDTRGWGIIDCMLNLPLLYWASEETGDPRFKQIAIKHADTAIPAFIRPDGSVNHIVEFDPFVGGVVTTHGGQGYEQGSSWSRGQTWAMYGFIMSYIHTKDERYLNAAKQTAHYFMANLPETGLIPVDFRQPKEPLIEDSTAAAIASCALLELVRHVPDFEQAMYYNAAIKLLKTLDQQRTDWTKANDCMVTHGTAAYHASEHHTSIIYGDYFFIEAILKLSNEDLYIW